jgi:hypothetical protein
VAGVAGVVGDDLLASTENIESMMALEREVLAHEDIDDDDADVDCMTTVPQQLPSNLCDNDPKIVASELLQHRTTVVRKCVVGKAVVVVFPVRLGCMMISHSSVAVASCNKTEELTTMRCTCEDKWKRGVNVSVSQHLAVDVLRDSLDQSSKEGCCHMLACESLLREGCVCPEALPPVPPLPPLPPLPILPFAKLLIRSSPLTCCNGHVIIRTHSHTSRFISMSTLVLHPSNQPMGACDGAAPYGHVLGRIFLKN